MRNGRQTIPPKFVCLFLLAWAATTVAAQATPNTAATNSMTVILYEFNTASLEPELSYLGGLIPVQLLRRLDFMTERVLSPAESEQMLAGTLRSKNEAARKAVADAARKRGSQTLVLRDPFERDASLRSVTKEYQDAIRAFEKTSASEVEAISPTLRLVFSQDNQKGVFPKLPDVSSETAKNSAASIAISGRVSRVMSWLKIDIEVTERLTRQTLLQDSFFTELDDLDAALAELVRPIATSVMGREYARLTLDVSPEQAEVKVQGRTLNQKHLLVFQAGTYAIEAALKNHSSDQRHLQVEPGRDYHVSFNLQPAAVRSLSIRTQPDSSTVYLDAVFAGLSPLELPGGLRDQVIRIEKEGFQPVTGILRAADSSSVLDFSLQALGDKSNREIHAIEKRQFLNALGWFICSLPVSVLSYGSFTMYYKTQETVLADSLAGRISDESLYKAKAELDPKLYGSQAVFWPSLGASILLGANAVYRLIRYIGSIR